jgi:hypothetical protein
MLRKFILTLAAFLLVLGLATFSNGSTAQAAALHPTIPTKALTCTPNNYTLQDQEYIVDQRQTNPPTDIGEIEIYADGCGWVYADAYSYFSNGFVNHIELHRYSDGSLVTAASYNGSSYNQTIHVDVGNTLVYAYGVVQVPAYSYWGQQNSLGINGYA